MVQLMNGPPDKSNRIWIGGVDDNLARHFSERVLEISAQDESKPIVLYINSPGGEANAMFTMLSIMDSVPNTFVTVAVGQAASAGAMLLAHGDIRFVAPYARVMIHEASGGMVGHVEDLQSSMQDFNALNIMAVETLAKNMGKTLRELKAIFKERGRDIHLSPEEAVKLGVADHVGVPTVKEVPTSQMKYEISLTEIKKTSVVRRASVGVVVKPVKAPKKKR